MKFTFKKRHWVAAACLATLFFGFQTFALTLGVVYVVMLVVERVILGEI